MQFLEKQLTKAIENSIAETIDHLINEIKEAEGNKLSTSGLYNHLKYFLDQSSRLRKIIQ
jgi:uncharacterized protein YggL (DUF469 family)